MTFYQVTVCNRCLKEQRSNPPGDLPAGWARISSRANVHTDPNITVDLCIDCYTSFRSWLIPSPPTDEEAKRKTWEAQMAKATGRT